MPTPEINEANVYDELAGEYDAAMAAVSQNIITRRFVKEKVLAMTTGHMVALDFGGGTGMDLEWLSEAFDKVFFVEPSSRMRQQALERAHGLHNVHFSEAADFRMWFGRPFAPAPTVVLANFGVLNSILSIENFFSSLQRVTGDQALVFALMLDTIPGESSFLRQLGNRWKLAFARRPVIFHGEVHHTIIHPLKSIHKASEGAFTPVESFKAERSPFTLHVFRKK
jgi:ubiquinone/menaquinone biosynthesis C-methylase UbiE